MEAIVDAKPDEMLAEIDAKNMLNVYPQLNGDPIAIIHLTSIALWAETDEPRASELAHGANGQSDLIVNQPMKLSALQDS